MSHRSTAKRRYGMAVVSALLLAASCGPAPERGERGESDAGPEGGETSVHGAPDAGSGGDTGGDGRREADAAAMADGSAETAVDVVEAKRETIRCTTELHGRGDSVDKQVYRFELVGEGGTWRADAALGVSHAEEAGGEPETLGSVFSGEATVSVDAEAFSATLGDRELTAEATEIEGVYRGEYREPDEEPLEAYCWRPNFELPYEYETATGECRNESGEAGRNRLPVPVVRETGRGECADLSGRHLNEEHLGYPVLTGWDLRGADLSNAELFFADLVEADLRGADLRSLRFGYAMVVGTVDDRTKPPERGRCERDDDAIECGR